MLRTILITNDPELAGEAEAAGVSRIMIDLEQIGKAERQKTRTTFISKHKPEDIAPMGKALKKAELIVRINPWHEHSVAEIDHAIQHGARRLMLPMIIDINQLSACLKTVAGRCRVLPLIETRYSMETLHHIVSFPEIDEVYFGLNDLHLSLAMRFLFEPLAEGHIDQMASIARKHLKPFGFGGIAALSGKAELPAINILAEHVRLGSSCVILSSRFAKDLALDEPAGRQARLEKALDELEQAYQTLSKRTPSETEQGHQETVSLIRTIAERLRKAGS
ncbi:MAG: aldolase/citrate lyase family protein [Rickettsiales bacterium]|jgi:2-keto-3-deoxy-L-rhamnonate aldolase RhmA|nr:aldolase/citrate lyase family protein [Rickettsiales bacterium]